MDSDASHLIVSKSKADVERQLREKERQQRQAAERRKKTRT